MKPTFLKSTRKNKKYRIKYNGDIIHCGQKRYEQFEDKALGLYKDQNHYDKKRRESKRKEQKE